jgi:hypothetical protein
MYLTFTRVHTPKTLTIFILATFNCQYFFGLPKDPFPGRRQKSDCSENTAEGYFPGKREAPLREGGAYIVLPPSTAMTWPVM